VSVCVRAHGAGESTVSSLIGCSVVTGGNYVETKILIHIDITNFN
jgi:hypothetical protein